MPAAAKSRPLIQPVSLPLPSLPPALHGLRLLQISDLHIRRPRPRYEQLLREVADAHFDFLVFTGDIMHRPPHEAAAEQFMRQLLQITHPRFGSIGCFGNHDSPNFKRRIADLPIKWLSDQCFDHPDLPIRFMGLDGQHRDHSGDLVATLLDCPPLASTVLNSEFGIRNSEITSPRFRILLSHEPRWLPAAADIGIDLMLAGHTHGGQVRLSPRIIFYNSQRHWPLRYTSGILRSGTTTLLISRGLGEAYFDHIRFLCPPQAPLITLQQLPTTSDTGAITTTGIQVIHRW